MTKYLHNIKYWYKISLLVEKIFPTFPYAGTYENASNMAAVIITSLREPVVQTHKPSIECYQGVYRYDRHCDTITKNKVLSTILY